MGELKCVEGVHWTKEMGVIAEVIEQNIGYESLAFLIEDIPDYPDGFWTLYDHLSRLSDSLSRPDPPTGVRSPGRLRRRVRQGYQQRVYDVDKHRPGRPDSGETHKRS